MRIGHGYVQLSVYSSCHFHFFFVFVCFCPTLARGKLVGCDSRRGTMSVKTEEASESDIGGAACDCCDLGLVCLRLFAERVVRQAPHQTLAERRVVGRGSL